MWTWIIVATVVVAILTTGIVVDRRRSRTPGGLPAGSHRAATDARTHMAVEQARTQRHAEPLGPGGI